MIKSILNLEEKYKEILDSIQYHDKLLNNISDSNQMMTNTSKYENQLSTKKHRKARTAFSENQVRIH